MTTHPNRGAKRLHRVKGDFMTEDGFLASFKPREMLVLVDSDGLAWPYLDVDTAYNASDMGKLEPLVAQRWGDGDRLGRQFSPDTGEFERCGIRFELCGSAAVADRH